MLRIIFVLKAIFRSFEFFSKKKRLYVTLIAALLIAAALYNTHKQSLQLYINDFETEEDIETLNHTCGKLMFLTDKHVTHGKKALFAYLPVGKYPGVSLPLSISDWSEYDVIKIDVFNPNPPLTLCIRIDDNLSCGDYYSRFNSHLKLSRGMNNISIKLSIVAQSPRKRHMNMSQVKKIHFFLIDTTRRYKLYFDALRLERTQR